MRSADLAFRAHNVWEGDVVGFYCYEVKYGEKALLFWLWPEIEVLLFLGQYNMVLQVPV